MTLVLYLSGAVLISLVSTSVQWSDCGTNSFIHFNSFDIHAAKGNVTVSFDGSITDKLIGPPQIMVTIEKNAMGPWTKVPCINQIGSCTYTDLCDFVKTFFNQASCPSVLRGKGCSGLSLYDPIPFYFDAMSFNMGTAAEGAKNVLTGSALRVQVEMVQQNKTVGCLAFFITLELPCTGFLCT